MKKDSAHSAFLAKRHWIFDLDGTLTVPVHDFVAIRAALGVPDGVDILGYLGALPKAKAIPLHARLDEIEDELAGRTEAAAGAVSLIELLHAGGTRLGVLTRNTHRNAMRTLKTLGVERFFHPECVLGRDEALPKPDPDGIHKLACRWGVTATDTVMVGDYLFDLQTGRAAGAATIHVDRTGVFNWPELTDLGVRSLETLVAELVSG